jgi:hypothetical protein
MKTIFFRKSGVAFLLIAMMGLALGFGFAFGEKHEAKNKWDLITNKDGLVYRINKQNGEVSLIAGTGAIKVEGTENHDRQKEVLPSVMDWPPHTIGSASNLVLTLKTKWRDGTLCYNFRIGKSDKLDQIGQNSPNAKITILLLDEDGFTVLSAPVMISDMNRVEGAGFEATGSIICGLSTYRSIKIWNQVWSGF